MSEAQTMSKLRDATLSQDVRAWLRNAVSELRAELIGNAVLRSTQRSVPLDLYGSKLPADVRSSWIFVLREMLAHLPERHPNSIQRMFALDCDGAMEVWDGGNWVRASLSANDGDPGLSIPALTWHRPAFLECPWGVVSFHTASENALIEELGDPSTGSVRSERTYASFGSIC